MADPANGPTCCECGRAPDRTLSLICRREATRRYEEKQNA